jgi:hypothetical protein
MTVVSVNKLGRVAAINAGGGGDVSRRRVNEDPPSELVYGLGTASSSTAAVPMWVCEVGVGVLVGRGKG